MDAIIMSKRNFAVHLPEELRKSVRIEALKQGLNLSEFIQKAARKYLDTQYQAADCARGADINTTN